MPFFVVKSWIKWTFRINYMFYKFIRSARIAGFGFSVVYTASSAILALHFERYKYLAFTAAILGVRIGTMTWPVVSQFLLSKFGYSQAMGILALPHVAHILAGILFFEPSKQDNDVSDDNSETATGITQNIFACVLYVFKHVCTLRHLSNKESQLHELCNFDRSYFDNCK